MALVVFVFIVECLALVELYADGPDYRAWRALALKLRISAATRDISANRVRAFVVYVIHQ